MDTVDKPILSCFLFKPSTQVSLQSMLNGSSAGSFADDIMKWQKRLQTIEAVLTVWLEVQEKWIELEDVSGVSEYYQVISLCSVYQPVNTCVLFHSYNRYSQALSFVSLCHTRQICSRPSTETSGS